MTVEEDEIVKILKEFNSRQITVKSKDLLQKCHALCVSYRLSEESFLNKYEAFVLNLSSKLQKGHSYESENELNEEILELFQKELMQQLGRSVKQQTVIHDKQSLKLLNSESKTSLPKGERNSGLVEFCFNEHIPSKPNESLANCRIELALISNEFINSRRHLTIKLSKKADWLNSRIETMCKEIQEENKLSEISHPGVPIQSRMITFGRIASDSDSKMNEKSVLLLSSKSVGSGCLVLMNLSELSEYSLFPGQIVLLEATNPNGYLLNVQKIFCELPLEYPMINSEKLLNYHHKDDLKLKGKPLCGLISAGPFTRDDSFDFVLLDDFLNACEKSFADFVILCGPFVDSDHSLLKAGKCPLPDEIFRIYVIPKLNGYAEKNQNCRLIVVPSLRDMFHDFVFPQPAFNFECPDNILLLSNPSSFFINELVFSVSTNDILFHLGGEEICKTLVNSDRIGRLCKHLLVQRSLYPLFPPAKGANIDFSKIEGLEMSVCPDFLILPSNLRFFAKNVEQTVCINPGQLSKKTASGTFAKVTIYPIPISEFPDEPVEMNNLAHKRSRVEIVRI